MPALGRKEPCPSGEQNSGNSQIAFGETPDLSSTKNTTECASCCHKLHPEPCQPSPESFLVLPFPLEPLVQHCPEGFLLWHCCSVLAAVHWAPAAQGHLLLGMLCWNGLGSQLYFQAFPGRGYLVSSVDSHGSEAAGRPVHVGSSIWGPADLMEALAGMETFAINIPGVEIFLSLVLHSHLQGASLTWELLSLLPEPLVQQCAESLPRWLCRRILGAVGWAPAAPGHFHLFLGRNRPGSSWNTTQVTEGLAGNEGAFPRDGHSWKGGGSQPALGSAED